MFTCGTVSYGHVVQSRLLGSPLFMLELVLGEGDINAQMMKGESMMANSLGSGFYQTIGLFMVEASKSAVRLLGRDT